MEQLRLLDLERQSTPRVALPQKLRDELVRRMAEAIVIIFKAQKGQSHDPSQDPS